MVSPHQDYNIKDLYPGVNSTGPRHFGQQPSWVFGIKVIDGMASLPCLYGTYGSMGYRKSGYVVTLWSLMVCHAPQHRHILNLPHTCVLNYVIGMAAYGKSPMNPVLGNRPGPHRVHRLPFWLYNVAGSYVLLQGVH